MTKIDDTIEERISEQHRSVLRDLNLTETTAGIEEKPKGLKRCLYEDAEQARKNVGKTGLPMYVFGVLT